MSASSPATTVDREPAVTRRPRGSLWTLRVVAVIAAFSVAVQPVLAGYYLDGDIDAIGVHATNADIVLMVVLIEAICALVFVTAGRGKGWPLLTSVLLWFAVGLQAGMGYAHVLAVHVPLGVAIVGTQLVMTVLLWRSGAREPRSWGRRG